MDLQEILSSYPRTKYKRCNKVVMDLQEILSSYPRTKYKRCNVK